MTRLSYDIDPLHVLLLSENDYRVPEIKPGFTDAYLKKDFQGQTGMLRSLNVRGVKSIFLFALGFKHLDNVIYHNKNNYAMTDFIHDSIQQQGKDRSRILLLNFGRGQVLVVLDEDLIKDRLTQTITDSVLSDENEIQIALPIHLRDYFKSRLRCWIDNAFLAKEMKLGREYIIEGDAIYPVDFKSTGVIETNKKWGDGLQQFLEMKHGLPRSPLSLITNFLTNIDFFERYGSNIVGVSGTLGDVAEKKFMSDIFSVDFATIPTSKQRKLFEIDGLILDNDKDCFIVVSAKIESALASQRAVLVICEDIATANKMHQNLSKTESELTLFLRTNSEGDHKMNKILKSRDVVITTNLGARGTDFVTDEVVNKNGGLFVIVTFIPSNDRVEKQAFGRTGRRGSNGSCQIIVNKKAMPEWLSLW